MHRPRDLQPSQDDSPMSKFRMAYEQWEVAPSCCQMLTWSITDGLLQPDQIMSRSSKVLATSTLTCPFHPPSISPPAPFHPWTKQTHVITLLFSCIRYASLSLGYHGTQETSYQCGNSGQICLRKSSNRWMHFCLQMSAILSTFWHPCRFGISQNEVDFYIVLKIGPC